MAGVVITLSEFVLWGLILEPQYQAMMARHSLAETPWAMAAYVGIALVMGLSLAFAYAGFRPRFGAGWRTGVAAGALVWLVGLAVPQLGNAAIGLGVGGAAAALVMVWALAELAIAGVVAGWVYQEQAAPAAAAARAPAM